MPPKRRNRQQPSAADQGPEDTPKRSESPTDGALEDWTDEQEATLFKSMISWKPVGMHRHFRMLAISGNLQASNGASSHDLHLQPKGIWEKLGKLYNLEALNEIVGYSTGSFVHWLNKIIQEDVTSLALRKDGDHREEPFCDFDLPDEDYWDMMFAKRIASERPSSPPQLAYQLHKDGPISRARQSTAEYTEEPRSSSVSNRGGRGSRGRVKRTSRLAEPAKGGQHGNKASIDDSVEGDTVEEDDVIAEDATHSKAGKAGGARRSGRKK